MTDGDVRLRSVGPVAEGLIDAVKTRDKGWIRAVCESAESGRIDLPALLVCLAAKAVGDD